MDNWIEVETELGTQRARDFLDGVLVADEHECQGFRWAKFIQGWKVKMKTGDMDHNKLVRR